MIAMKLRTIIRCAVAVVLFALAASAGLAQETPGKMFAAGDGKGHVSLFWFPPPAQWPAGGWRLSDSTGQVLVPQIKMADPAAMEPLSVEDRDIVQKLSAVFASPDTSQQRKQFLAILSLRAFSEPDFARALGLSWTLNNVSAGSRTYKVEGLDCCR